MGRPIFRFQQKGRNSGASIAAYHPHGECVSEKLCHTRSDRWRAMSKFRHYFAFFLVAMLIAMVGCSGSSSPPIRVSLSPPSAQAIDQTQTVAITATVASDTSRKGVSWSPHLSLTSSRRSPENIQYDPI